MGIIQQKKDNQELVKTEIGKIKIAKDEIKTLESNDDQDEVSKKELVIAGLVVIALILVIATIFLLTKGGK